MYSCVLRQPSFSSKTQALCYRGQKRFKLEVALAVVKTEGIKLHGVRYILVFTNANPTVG